VRIVLFIQLEEQQYSNIVSLFDYTGYECVFAFAVIEKNIPGRIYVDDVVEPTVALLCSACGKYLVIGDETNAEFNKAVSDFLREKSNHIKFFDLYASSQEWIEVLSRALNGEAAVLRFCVYYYDNNKELLPTTASEILAEGFEIKQVDDVLFEKIAAEFSPSFKNHFGSTQKFCSDNFGFCITKEDEVVSVAISTYTGNGYAEIDIETRRDFYRNGLAFELCRYFIEYCQQNALVALWVCDAGNNASKQLANKLGFTKAIDIEMLWWHENKGTMAKYLNNFGY
jgi:RimJ/RimL family protein N-acetyltransferase